MTGPDATKPAPIAPPATNPTTKRPGPWTKAASPELRELAKTLYVSGVIPSVIASQTGLKVATVQMWATRYKWGMARDKAKQALAVTLENKPVRVSAPVVSERSARVRALLGEVVERHAQVLQEAPAASVADLADTNGKQGLARVAKTVAETAAQVFDWESERNPGLVLVGDVSAAEPVIDLPPEATPLQVVDQPENPA